jgi:serine/threonine-protein kinase RsbW
VIDTVGDLRVAAVPAVATSLTWLRQVLTDWALHTPLCPEQVVELRVAAYEALANVVEHAYRRGGAGIVDVHAAWSTTHDTITVTVTDHGRWQPSVLDRRSPGGHGLQLIHALSDIVNITTSRAGTTVRMAWRPRPVRSARPA